MVIALTWWSTANTHRRQVIETYGTRFDNWTCSTRVAYVKIPGFVCVCVYLFKLQLYTLPPRRTPTSKAILAQVGNCPNQFLSRIYSSMVLFLVQKDPIEGWMKRW